MKYGIIIGLCMLILLVGCNHNYQIEHHNAEHVCWDECGGDSVLIKLNNNELTCTSNYNKTLNVGKDGWILVNCRNEV